MNNEITNEDEVTESKTESKALKRGVDARRAVEKPHE